MTPVCGDLHCSHGAGGTGHQLDQHRLRCCPLICIHTVLTSRSYRPPTSPRTDVLNHGSAKPQRRRIGGAPRLHGAVGAGRREIADGRCALAHGQRHDDIERGEGQFGGHRDQSRRRSVFALPSNWPVLEVFADNMVPPDCEAFIHKSVSERYPSHQ